MDRRDFPKPGLTANAQEPSAQDAVGQDAVGQDGAAPGGLMADSSAPAGTMTDASAPAGSIEDRDVLLDDIADASPATASVSSLADAMPGARVGVCIDDRHPTLSGRVQVRWREGDTEHTRWLPCLLSVTVRRRDRVLLIAAGNCPEPLVVGVVDGFKRRPEPARTTAAQVELRDDEVLQVAASDGTALVEVHRGAKGAVVRLLDHDVDVELPGALRLKARAIALQAVEGEIQIEASDDVIVRGENINLN